MNYLKRIIAPGDYLAVQGKSSKVIIRLLTKACYVNALQVAVGERLYIAAALHDEVAIVLLLVIVVAVRDQVGGNITAHEVTLPQNGHHHIVLHDLHAAVADVVDVAQGVPLVDKELTWRTKGGFNV